MQISEDIIKQIETNQVKQLNLHGIHLHEQDIDNLTKALQKNSSIKEIDLSNCNLSLDLTAKLAIAVQTAVNLHPVKINLNNNTHADNAWLKTIKLKSSILNFSPATVQIRQALSDNLKQKKSFHKQQVGKLVTFSQNNRFPIEVTEHISSFLAIYCWLTEKHKQDQAPKAISSNFCWGVLNNNLSKLLDHILFGYEVRMHISSVGNLNELEALKQEIKLTFKEDSVSYTQCMQQLEQQVEIITNITEKLKEQVSNGQFNETVLQQIQDEYLQNKAGDIAIPPGIKRELVINCIKNAVPSLTAIAYDSRQYHLFSELAQYISLDCRLSTDRASVLHIATNDNNLDAINSLLKAGANVNNSSGIRYACLHLATINNNLDIIKRLIEAGADLLATTPKGDGELYPIHLAAQHGYLPVLDFFINSGISASIKTNMLQTPLHIAIEHGQLAIVNRLISAGANLYDTNAAGNSPLSMAVNHPNKDIRTAVTEQCRPDKMLTIAIEQNNVEMITLAIKSGATVGDKHLNVLKVIAQKGNIGTYDLFTKATNHFDSSTCYQLAIQHGNVNMIIALNSREYRPNHTAYTIHHPNIITAIKSKNATKLLIALYNVSPEYFIKVLETVNVLQLIQKNAHNCFIIKISQLAGYNFNDIKNYEGGSFSDDGYANLTSHSYLKKKRIVRLFAAELILSIAMLEDDFETVSIFMEKIKTLFFRESDVIHKLRQNRLMSPDFISSLSTEMFTLLVNSSKINLESFSDFRRYIIKYYSENSEIIRPDVSDIKAWYIINSPKITDFLSRLIKGDSFSSEDKNCLPSPTEVSPWMREQYKARLFASYYLHEYHNEVFTNPRSKMLLRLKDTNKPYPTMEEITQHAQNNNGNNRTSKALEKMRLQCSLS